MRKANLVLHAGASAATREQLTAVVTPNRTETWVPLPHHELLAGVEATLSKGGLHVVSEAHGLTRDGQRYFGLLQVANGDNADDFGLVVGVRNSHDKSFPAALALGAQVFVCDNLSFNGEVKLSRKHTAFIARDLPQLIERAVGLLGNLRQTQEQRFDAYRNTALNDATVHDLAIRAIDARVLPVTKLPHLLQEWREPSHQEFAEAKNGWRFWNAMTETLKGNLIELPKRTTALHGLMDAACGLIVPGTSLQLADATIEVNQAL